MELSFPLHKRFVTRTDNKPNKAFPGGSADYITIHMTGNRKQGADAASHAKWMAEQAEYSWHATVDDREAWQSIRWTEQGWHAGDGYWGMGNQESIGLELCMAAGMDQLAVYEHGAELTAALLNEGHGAKGVVQHNYWSGKNCPELIRAEPGRWEWFLSRVDHYSKKETDMTPEEVAAIVRKIVATEDIEVDSRLRDVEVMRFKMAHLAFNPDASVMAAGYRTLKVAGLVA